MLSIRHTVPQDYETLLQIYAYARAQMVANGNPTQWGQTRPAPAVVRQDIEMGLSYVVENDGAICGVFAFFIGHDSTYDIIKDGAWLNEAPYGVIHRIASGGTCHGILRAALDFAAGQIDNIRIDTHRNNLIMQNALAKNGFVRCGIIYTDDGTERIAFQRIQPHS